ncbi:MAG: hypothetical protein JWP74_3920 [Marmoricola sp.]|nr:hypothetical protein [Marmoricola sp.]
MRVPKVCAAALLVAALAGSATAAGYATLHGHRVFSFTDPAITESSALLDFGSFMVTTNDSGGLPLVYVIDPRTGATIGTTTYASSVVDTEALAVAGRNQVWVGDVGDNLAERSSVQVYRIPVGPGNRTVHATRYDLVYPDGAHDAESLLYGRDGRLRIISKSLLGGHVYTAPKHLDPNRPNRLVRGRPVDVFATDAALFPNGRHVIVRGYGDAEILTYPGFRQVAFVNLPREQQGEGVSISRTGRIRLSSEGEHSPVLQVRLPASVRTLLHPRAVSPPRSAPGARGTVVPDNPWRDHWPLLAGGAVVVAGASLLLRRRLIRS